MPATKPLYDLVLMLDTTAEDSRRQEIVASAEAIVAAGGEVVNKQDWGPRQMAFEIRHKKDADYHLLQFHATAEVLERLDRQLRIVDEVVRYRIVKLAPGTPPPVEQRAEPRPASVTVDAPADDTAAEAAEPVAVDAPAEAEAAPAEAVADTEPADAEPAAAPAGD
ncbi:MAG TPA: 30S ribosomal protein S6 [Solirubrobacteraceae bacterium]|nr:30S ribosomal protein S6 [Solirubrobacteraceae bacterium]